jgi:hypothetical protein
LPNSIENAKFKLEYTWGQPCGHQVGEPIKDGKDENTKKKTDIKLTILLKTILTNEPVIALVDTGSDVSLIKQKCLKPNTIVNPNSNISFSGISHQSIMSLGTIKDTLMINNDLFEHELQIIDNHLNLPYDAIIGMDFLNKFTKISIDINNLKLTLTDKKKTYTIKINTKVATTKKSYVTYNINKRRTKIQRSYLKKTYDVDDDTDWEDEPPEINANNYNTITNNIKMQPLQNENTCDENFCYFTKTNGNNFYIRLPPRSEVVVNLPVKGNDRTFFTVSEQPLEGVLVPSALIRVKNNRALIVILNSTEEEKCLENFQLTEEPMTNYEVLQINYGEDVARNRIQKLRQILKLDHLDKDTKEKIQILCEKYHMIFHLPGDRLGYTDLVKHSIQLQADTEPINVRQFKIPHHLRSEVERQVEQLLEDNIIRESDSPFNNPIFLVKKKGTAEKPIQHRMVVDFRALNKKSVAPVFPLPAISDLFDLLGRARVFSTIDVKNGYHQMALDANSSPFTAFSCGANHYEFIRLAFGLKSGPAAFQKLMNTVLHGLIGIKALLYMDDACVFSSSVDSNIEALTEVFERFRKYNLKLNPEKCNLIRSEITFLGHICGENGLRPDPKLVHSVENFPIPKNTKELQAFLGLANYYRKFIKNHASIVRPLTDQIRTIPTTKNNAKRNIPIEWDAIKDHAFEEIKQQIISAPTLKFPDLNEPFIIRCDASLYCIAGILSQQEEEGERPIGFCSRRLNKTEEAYSATERELLAILFTIQNFKQYLYGAPKQFIVYSDHKSLSYDLNVSNVGSRIAKMRSKLEDYHLEIRHIPGKDNIAADTLSRFPPNIETDAEKKKALVTTRNQQKKLDEIVDKNQPDISKSQTPDRPIPSEIEEKSYNNFLHSFQTKNLYNKNVIINSSHISKEEIEVFITDSKLEVLSEKHRLLLQEQKDLTNIVEIENKKGQIKTVIFYI